MATDLVDCKASIKESETTRVVWNHGKEGSMEDKSNKKPEYTPRRFGPLHTYRGLRRDLIFTGMLVVILIVLKVIS